MTTPIWLERLWQDVRHGTRVFAKHPGFTAIAVLSIAFGTGANIAMFSATDALLLRPLPVSRPSELVAVGFKERTGLLTLTGASFPDYVDIRQRAQSFTGLVAYTTRRAAFSPDPRTPQRMKVATLVSGNFFRVLGVEPVLGRGFLDAEDEVPGRDAVAVLSHGMWQTEFNGDPAVLGRRVLIAGIEFTVIGVAPEHFTGLEPRYFPGVAYVPLAMSREVFNDPAIDPLTSRDDAYLDVKGRLRPGVTLSGARAELAVIGKDLATLYPQTNTGRIATAQTELEVRFEQAPLDSTLLVLLSTLSIAVLGVACANVAGLLSSRAPVRAREMALRLAIGAGRARLVRQLVTESLGIAVVGGLGGLVVGEIGISVIRQIRLPTDLVAIPAMVLDYRVLLFSVVIAMASAFLFGLGPAIQMTKVDLASALKSTDAGSVRRKRLTGRSTLVAVQVALSLVLVTIAVFAFQVFHQAFTAGPGFRTTHLAKFSIEPRQARYSEARATQFFESAAENARHVAGVRSVGLASIMPLSGIDFISLLPEGHEFPVGQDGAHAHANSVDEGYFEAMNIPILAGRSFRSSDAADAARVAVVNQVFAAHYWLRGNAVGQRFRLGDDRGPWVEVVGVAAPSKYAYYTEPNQEAVYFPFRQRPRGRMVLLAETVDESSSALTPLRQMLQATDADVPVYDVQTIETFYEARATGIGNVVIRMIAGMGLMGMTLTMVGLYGLVSYAASRRTREIGVRMAIGATYGRILRMILRQGMAPAWSGVAVGLALSVATTRAFPALIPLEHEYDARMFFVIVPLLLVVALVAGFIPARRAAKLPATVALRQD